jgi:hypothetical protein
MPGDVTNEPLAIFNTHLPAEFTPGGTACVFYDTDAYSVHLPRHLIPMYTGPRTHRQPQGAAKHSELAAHRMGIAIPTEPHPYSTLSSPSIVKVPYKSAGRGVVHVGCAPGETRTHTGEILSLLSLPDWSTGAVVQPMFVREG